MEDVYGDELPKLWSAFIDGYKDAFGANGGRMSEEDLKRIKAHTLILHGAKDQLVSKDHPPLMRKMIRSNEYILFLLCLCHNCFRFNLNFFSHSRRYYEFPEGKHNIHLRYADEFNTIISEFLLREM